MRLDKNANNNYTVRQLKLPPEIEKLIDISDPIYTFRRAADRIDLSRYFVAKRYKTGRPRCDKHKLLKMILLAFMEHGISSLHDIEELCGDDIQYLYLPDDMKTPSFTTFGSFIREELIDFIEQTFLDANTHVFQEGHVDLEHVYLDRTKIGTNANRYTWVWKKSCTKSRGKIFEKISTLLDAMNQEVLGCLNLKLEEREEYAINYVSGLLELYRKGTGLEKSTPVSGCGHRKNIYQRQYQELQGYLECLKTHAHHIEVCGEERGNHSKTGHSATFMRLKRDYVGDDQLLPAYNLQTAICNEYIAVVDMKPHASSMGCFISLMEKFHGTYGCYPKHPVVDVGYGSYNDYLYCEEHGMEKYMKFTIFQKETKDKKYHENSYRAVNFQRDGSGDLLCSGGRRSRFKCRRPIHKNRYGRTEGFYGCESREGCEYKSECSPKASGNRTVRMNEELTAIRQEMLSNLKSIHGTLLRMNKSIQAEGTFGVSKRDKSYKRLFRRGEKNIILEPTLISCGFNIYKYHNRKQRKEAVV